MNDAANVDVLDVLWHTHQEPGAGHASVLSGVDVGFDEGQALQVELLKRHLANGEAIGGWKLGMTSGASRNAMGDGVRPFGFVLKSRVITSGDTLSLATLAKGQVENELCFLMREPLGAGATADDARRAVAGAVPAFEVNQKRLPGDVSAGVRVADDLSNWGIVVGEPVAPPVDLSGLEVAIHAGGDLIERVASEGHIDDHYETLATLANRLAEFGQSLQAGHYVITGAYGKTPFAPGHFHGEFSLGVGNVEINLQ